MKPKFEEGATCLDCGLETEVDNLNTGSLDAYATGDDYDHFCPKCHGNNIKFHKPAEDQRRASSVLERRIVPVINPTENQKSVLAKIKVADTPKLAAADISADKNLTAARDMLVRLGFITLNNDGAALTPEGDQVMIDQGLVDESGELTDIGQTAAYGENGGEEQMESYKIIQSLNENVRREKYQDVPSDLLDKLTPEEERALYNALDDRGDITDNSSLWNKLFDYFVSDMPYGTAKARTGDPGDWILDRLQSGTEGGNYPEDRYDR